MEYEGEFAEPLLLRLQLELLELLKMEDESGRELNA
jgi:hypothetical protein